VARLAGRARACRRTGRTRPPRHPGGLDPGHDRHRSVPGRLRHLRTGAAGWRGGGEGSSPIWTPTSKTILPIQVIGQQWKFTYRYPTFGGFETDQLVVPNDTTIQFNVTSLDVIHSFWAYQLGVKADANPDYNNVAYTTPQQLGSFTVRCAELCGLWHGAMYNGGVVVTPQQFEAWAKGTEFQLRKNTKLLPPYALTYTPDANGADGGYYPDNVDPYSKVETYGASKGS
jgi:cytochrome c oxidase subunit 2